MKDLEKGQNGDMAWVYMAICQASLPKRMAFSQTPGVPNPIPPGGALNSLAVFFYPLMCCFFRILLIVIRV